jgi:hypothetical protein
VNDAPIDDTTALEDELYIIDYDADDYDNDLLIWSLDTNATTFLTIEPATGLLSGIPTNNDVGSYWVNVSVSDGNGGTDYTNFTLTVTNVNNPPNKPNNLNPSNGASSININAILSWTCSDPDGDILTYDVYFGISNPPSKIISNQSSTNYDPNLNYDTTYYWMIKAWDPYNESNTSNIWSFTTQQQSTGGGGGGGGGGGPEPPPRR